MRAYRGWAAGVVLAALVGGSAAPQEPKPPAPKYTPEQLAKLKEADALFAEVQAAEKAGDWKAAAAGREKLLTITREVYGPKSAQVVTLLRTNAEFHERAGNPKAAANDREAMIALAREVYGTKSTLFAALLRDNGEFYTRVENWAAARAALREAIELLIAAQGQDNWRVADARGVLADVDLYEKMTPEDRAAARRADGLNAEGVRLSGQGKYDKAREQFARAADVYKKFLGGEHPTTLKCLENVAQQDRLSGEYDKAEATFKEVLAARRKVLGKRHPATAVAMNNLGLLYRTTAEFAKAELLYKEALAIYKEWFGDRDPFTATALNNIAALHFSSGEYDKAAPIFKQVLALRREILGPRHPDTTTSLNNLGLLYFSSGEYAKAEPLYREALTIRWTVLGKRHPLTATSLNNLAALYKETGEYEKAEQLYTEALTVYRSVLGDRHPDTARALNNLAALYSTTRQDAQRAGLDMEAIRQYAKAEQLYKEALAARRAALGDRHPDTAMSMSNLALLYNETGEYAKAEPLFKEALAACRATLGDRHPDTARALNNLAWLHYSTGEYAKAEPLFKEALATLRTDRGDRHPHTVATLNNLALLYRTTGEYAKAEPLCKEALAGSFAYLDETADVQSEPAQIAFAASVRNLLNNYLATTAARGGEVPAEVHAALLRWKGRVFVRQRRQRELLRASTDPATAALTAALLDTTRRLAAVAGQTPKPAQADAWKARVALLRDERNGLERQLLQKSAGLREQKERLTLTPDHLGRLLPPKTALVDFLVYRHFTPKPRVNDGGTAEERLVAFVARPDRAVVRVDLGAFAPIREAVEEWRKDTKRRRPVLKDADGDDDPGDPAAVLRDKLWLPVAKHLDGAETVLISPDADLARLPFAALPGSKPGTYLIEERAVAVLPVPQFLPDLLGPPAGAAPSLLAVGDVDYGADPGTPTAGIVSRAAVRGDRGGGWKPLPATREELAAVRGAFEAARPGGAARVLRQGEPTEGAVRDLLGKHRWVHLATHGFFADPAVKSAAAGDGVERKAATGQMPGLLSGVVLAGANRRADPLSEADDGVLTAAEVATLDLGGTEVVVLSACETGLGAVAGGEGVLGLQRAFQVAGCRTTVTSLWEVPDDATQKLMTRAYRNWWGGKQGKLTGLVEAQRELLREGVPGAGKGPAPPFYWAAFVLAGDWR